MVIGWVLTRARTNEVGLGCEEEAEIDRRGGDGSRGVGLDRDGDVMWEIEVELLRRADGVGLVTGAYRV